MNTDVSKLIVEIVGAAETGVGSIDIHRVLKRRLRSKAPGYSTVQKKLVELVEEGKLARARMGRAFIYQRPAEATGQDAVDKAGIEIPISGESKAVREYVRRPLQARHHIGYQRDFLEEYIPNHTAYLPDNIRRDLRLMGEFGESAPVGSTYQPET